MKKILCLLLILSIFSSTIVYADNIIKISEEVLEEETAQEKHCMELRDDIVEYASSFASEHGEIKTPYIWGGKNINVGVDCSGFVSEVYKHFDIDIHKATCNGIYKYLESTGEGSVVAVDAKKEDLEAMLPGDIVFFYVPGRDLGHIGIYGGDNKLIHSKNEGVGVVIEDLFTGDEVSLNTKIPWVMRFPNEYLTGEKVVVEEELVKPSIAKKSQGDKK